MDIISQLTALGRNATSPWAIIKADNKKIYAYHLTEDKLWRLSTRKDANGERIRFDNSCLKYYFGNQWDNGAIALQKLADQGSDLFLIPNYIPLDPEGANGIGADFISHADSLFCEIDDLSIPEQWQKIEEVKATLGLEPSLVVFSGGKSLHIYFRLEQPLTDLSHWKRLQQKLICLFNSDPAIANANREMRLAGVARKSKDSFQSIELKRDRAYGIQEIETLLDGSGLFPYGMDDDRFRFYRREGRSALTKLPEEINPPRPQVQPREINPSDSDRFPLEICVTKHDQDLINGGAGSDRNNQGLKLAKNLIATADRLTQLGFVFEGDPYSLFIEYCQCCSSGGGWDSREWEMIWRSANLGNPSPSLPDEALLNRISYWNWEQNGFPRRDDSYQPIKEPPEDEYQAYEQELEEEEKIAEAEKEREREQWRDQFPQAAKNSYNRLKTFTPDQHINKPFLSKEDIPIEKGIITAILSGLGTNKTGAIGEIVQELDDEKWLALIHRNNLGIQTSQRWGFDHLPTIKVNGESIQASICHPKSKIVCCFDSLIKFHPKDLDGRNIILDETTAGILHLLTSGTAVKGYRDETLELFKEALKRAKRIFCLDGMLTDSAIAYLHKLVPEKEVIKIQNDYSNPMEIHHYIGTTVIQEDEPHLKKGDRAPLVDMMVYSDCPVVVSDSQVFVAAAAKMLTDELGENGLQIDSTTMAEDWAKEFMKNPDAYIRKHKPKWLAMSPSCENGVDIAIRDYFTELFGFFFGAIGTDAQHEMLFRVRDENLARFFWCNEFDSKSEKLRSPFPQQNLRNHRDLLVLDIQNSFDNGEDVTEKLKALSEMTKENPHDEMWGNLEAMYSYEKGNLRECLIESLEAKNHKIIPFSETEEMPLKREKKAKEEVKDEYSEAIFNAEDIDQSEIEERKEKGKFEDQCAVKKKLLKIKLPGIADTPYWEVETVRLLEFDDRDRINHLRRYWMLNNLEEAQRLQQKRWEKFQEGIISKYHIRSDYSKILALINAGIETFMEEDKEWYENSPEVQAFFNECKKHEFKLAFGKAPGRNSHPMQWLRTCLDYFGFKTREKRKRVNGDRVRFYKIIPLLETDQRNPAFYGCIKDYFAEKLKKDKEATAQAKQEETEKSTQDETARESQAVPPLTVSFKQNSKGGTVPEYGENQTTAPRTDSPNTEKTNLVAFPSPEGSWTEEKVKSYAIALSNPNIPIGERYRKLFAAFSNADEKLGNWLMDQFKRFISDPLISQELP